MSFIEIWGDFENCGYSKASKTLGNSLAKKGHRVKFRKINIFDLL